MRLYAIYRAALHRARCTAFSAGLGVVTSLGLGLGLATAQAADAPFLWTVHGKDAATTHYLLGSVHLQPQDAVKLPSGLEAAYKAAQALSFETDISALNSPALQQQMQIAGINPSAGFGAAVGVGVYAQTQARLRQLGLPVQLCDRLRVWLCALTLELSAWQRAGFAGASGIDRQLFARAGEDGKPRHWLESPQQQVALFTEMPADTALELLRSELDDAAAGDDDPRTLYSAWRNNDAATIEHLGLVLKQGYPAFYESLLAARTRHWLPQLQATYGQREVQLVVVGAAHCVGEDGLVAQLRMLGFTVNAVQATAPVKNQVQERANGLASPATDPPH